MQRPFHTDIGQVRPGISAAPANHMAARALPFSPEEGLAAGSVPGRLRRDSRRSQRTHKGRNLPHALIGKRKFRHAGSRQAVADGLKQPLIRQPAGPPGEQARTLAPFPRRPVATRARAHIELSPRLHRGRINRHPAALLPESSRGWTKTQIRTIRISYPHGRPKSGVYGVFSQKEISVPSRLRKLTVSCPFGS